MLEKKLEYSNLMTAYTEEERTVMWGKRAYLYKDKYYIDADDEKAFKDEVEAEEAIQRELKQFMKENNFLVGVE